MYLQYYGLDDYPFSVTPDPTFLYLGTPHREALGHLLYGAGEHGGFVQLTGEVGTGKTTLIRALLENPVPDLDVALCWHPQLDVREFVATICDELGVPYAHDADITLKALVDQLNTHLLKSHAAGRRTLLIIDEAQNLKRDVLEQLRLLTNLETNKHKLLRIILVGQPELDTFLARHDLRQLSQRISARSTLSPLDRHETADYINHRLACAGGSGRLFSPAACRMVYWYTRGTPRLINLICERALMGGYAHGRLIIGPLTVHKAARETLPQSTGVRWLKHLKRPAVAAVAVLLVILALSTMTAPHFKQMLAWVTSNDASIVDEAKAAAIMPIPATSSAADATRSKADRAKADTVRADEPVPDIAAKPLMLSSIQSPEGNAEPVRLAANTKPGKASKRATANQRDKKQSGKSDDALPANPASILPKGNAQLSQLLRLWGVFGASTPTSCAHFNVGNLHCLSEEGKLAMLDRFNRPALLTLEYNDQQQRVLLTQLGKKEASLRGAQATRRISREQLARLWSGQFSMIWRANTGVIYIQDNMIGAAVVWLRNRLQRILKKKEKQRVGPASPVFDKDLEDRVRHFQLMHGLKPDGIAGPRTQIMLNGIAPANGTPTLKPNKEDKG